MRYNFSAQFSSVTGNKISGLMSRWMICREVQVLEKVQLAELLEDCLNTDHLALE